MKLKKMIAAVLTMAMVATALPVTAMAATTADKLPDAENGVITLEDDYVLTQGHEITGTVTLDLNGHSIIPATGDAFTKGAGKEDYLLAVTRGGTLTIVDNVGTGIIDGSSNNKIVCAVKMTIYGEAENGDAATLIVDGAAIKGAPYGISGNGNRHNTSVTIKNGTVEGEDVGVFQPQDGELTIIGGKITGATGVEVRNGDVTVTGGTITGTGDSYSLNESGNGNTTSGVGLAVVPHSNGTTKATVSGGAVSGEVGAVVTANDGGDATTERDGSATLTVTGEADVKGESYGLRVLDGAEATVSGNASVDATDASGFGIYVRGLDDNATVKTKLTVAGGTVSGGENAIAGNGYAKNGGTDIDITGGTITADNGVAIYNPQSGTLDITGGTITGTSGVYVKDGKVTIGGNAMINGTATGTEYNPTNDGSRGTGAAVVIEHNPSSYGTPSVTIDGGTMNGSSDAPAVQSVAPTGETPLEDVVKGGNFSKPVDKELLKDSTDYVVKTGNGYSYFEDQNTAQNAAQAAGTGTSVFETDNALNEDGSVKADAAPVYTVPAPAPSKGGSSKPKYTASIDKDEIENGTVKLSSTRAKAGSKVTVTVTPDEGYELKKLEVLDKNGDKVEVTDNGDGTFTFKMPKGGVEVVPTFAEAEDEAAVEKEVTTLVLTIGQNIYQQDGNYAANDVAPIIQNDRTFLPIRLIAEALGAAVTWSEADQSVTIVEGDTTIVIYIGQAFALVNGEPVQLDTEAFISNDRTYLPVRFVSENLGATVTWDAVTNKVTIVG